MPTLQGVMMDYDEAEVQINSIVGVGFIAEPIINAKREVVAFEVLSRFHLSESSGNIIFPAEFVFRKLSKKEKELIFIKQIHSICDKKYFFQVNNIICTINVDNDIANFICQSNEMKSILMNMPYMRLEISEKSTHLREIKSGNMIDELSENFTLWLDDFGSGYSNLSAIQTGIFETVKIDKGFFWKNINKNFWGTTLKQIKRYTKEIIVEGVENEVHYRKVKDSVEGVQGYLFPGTPLNYLNSENKYYSSFYNAKDKTIK